MSRLEHGEPPRPVCRNSRPGYPAKDAAARFRASGVPQRLPASACTEAVEQAEHTSPATAARDRAVTKVVVRPLASRADDLAGIVRNAWAVTSDAIGWLSGRPRVETLDDVFSDLLVWYQGMSPAAGRSVTARSGPMTLVR